MQTAKEVLKAIKDNDVQYVDFRFTDPRGKWQHVTFDVGMVDEDLFADGIMFDGSSIAGWKAINESDMTLMPDPTTAQMDPFFSGRRPASPITATRAASPRRPRPICSPPESPTRSMSVPRPSSSCSTT
jgi:glutamine synthetase